MQKWRNWQTRTVQVRVVVIPWGFDSLLLQDLNRSLETGSCFFVVGYIENAPVTCYLIYINDFFCAGTGSCCIQMRSQGKFRCWSCNEWNSNEFKNCMFSRNLSVPDFVRRFFVSCAQISEAYAVRTVMKFGCDWRKIGHKGRCRKDSERTLTLSGVH